MQSRKRVADLQGELRILERGLKRYSSEVRKLVGDPGGTERLADLQDRIRTDEQRATGIREEIIALGQEIVDEKDLACALHAFDPVWDSLSPKEQARVIRLLLEKVGYDGDKGSVAVTFRPNGIKALAQEVNTIEEAAQE
jgi:site-specific DNA recombinase